MSGQLTCKEAVDIGLVLSCISGLQHIIFLIDLYINSEAEKLRTSDLEVNLIPDSPLRFISMPVFCMRN